MNTETLLKLAKKFPKLSSAIASLGALIGLLGFIVVMFVFQQMFDDKQTYNSGNTVVDFINWISNAGSSDAAASSAESNGVTSYETEADHTSVVESNQTGTVDRVGNDQTSVHK